jgi:hypothetical protein
MFSTALQPAFATTFGLNSLVSIFLLDNHPFKNAPVVSAGMLKKGTRS